MESVRKICFVTGSRAEYGIMSRLMKMVQADASLQLQVIATNMHLSPTFGLTYREIEADDITIDKKVDMMVSGDTASAVTKSLGLGIIGFADAYADLKPDLLVVLGDRYEILGAVSAALLFQIPVAHISGGDITEGAYDDAIRHAITKMSHLHFPTTEEYRNRVIQLGEQPDHVWNMGSLSVDNMKHVALMSREELEESLGFKLDKPTALVTYHPVTMEADRAGEQCDELLAALDAEPLNLIFTMPNSDNNGVVIMEKINEYVAAHPARAIAVKSLGYKRYLSALQFVALVVGNSSSGIAEVPSFHIPTVNIGIRQKGRIRGNSVIHCDPTRQSISAAISQARTMAANADDFVNPYEQSDTAAKILEVLKTYPLDGLEMKQFYNIAQQ